MTEVTLCSVFGILLWNVMGTAVSVKWLEYIVGMFSIWYVYDSLLFCDVPKYPGDECSFTFFANGTTLVVLRFIISYTNIYHHFSVS